MDAVPHPPNDGRQGAGNASHRHRGHRRCQLASRPDLLYGANISEQYAGTEFGTGRFVDVLLRVEGPAVRALGEAFLQSLREATSATGERAAPSLPRSRGEGAPACVLGLNARLNRKALDRLLREAVGQAQERCLVTAAYFIAPPWLRKTLARSCTSTSPGARRPASQAAL